MRSKMNKREKKLVLIILVMLISAIFGFIYEEIFYRIDLGYFVKRGSTIGPWLPIYATGGVLIYLINQNNKKSAFFVFIKSLFICGILEYLVGYLLFNISQVRLWDYNTEILNYGNIGGFICLRSVLFFGLSGIFLMKVIVPLLEKMIKKNKSKKILYVTVFVGSLFILDFIINYIIK